MKTEITITCLILSKLFQCAFLNPAHKTARGFNQPLPHTARLQWRSTPPRLLKWSSTSNSSPHSSLSLYKQSYQTRKSANFSKNILNFEINIKILRGISERKLCKKIHWAAATYLKSWTARWRYNFPSPCHARVGAPQGSGISPGLFNFFVLRLNHFAPRLESGSRIEECGDSRSPVSATLLRW